MSTCICNPDTHVTVCTDEIPPMGGAVIPAGVQAVQTFVNGEVIWQTDPAQPAGETVNFLVQQNGGKILIDDDVFLIL